MPIEKHMRGPERSETNWSHSTTGMRAASVFLIEYEVKSFALKVLPAPRSASSASVHVLRIGPWHWLVDTIWRSRSSGLMLVPASRRTTHGPALQGENDIVGWRKGDMDPWTIGL